MQECKTKTDVNDTSSVKSVTITAKTLLYATPLKQSKLYKWLKLQTLLEEVPEHMMLGQVKYRNQKFFKM